MGRTVSNSIKDAAKPKKKKKKNKLYVPTGSTLLNLKLSGTPDGGFQSGSMANVIGDSSAGKTFTALTMLAECANDPRFDSYDLIYDDAEHRNSFDVCRLFGDKFHKRVKPPGGFTKTGRPINSKYLPEFQDHLNDRFDKNKKMIYVLDSFDSLTTIEDEEQYEKEREARAKGKEVSGSYGMYKAKAASALFRQITSKLSETDSLLVVVSQTRANIGLGFSPKTRSGGAALKFYSDHELWLAVVETLKKSDTPIGVKSRIKITKNSVTGQIRQTNIQIYYDYGIDDITANIEYLMSQKTFKKLTKATFTCPELDFKAGTKQSLVKHVEENDLEQALVDIVVDVDEAFEDSLKLKRKGKYS